MILTLLLYDKASQQLSVNNNSIVISDVQRVPPMGKTIIKRGRAIILSHAVYRHNATRFSFAIVFGILVCLGY